MATALVLCCAVAVTGTSNPCLGDERSEAWKAERSGCKRERAGSTSMEASSLSAAGAPSTPLWTVGYRDWLAASSGRGSATAPSCVGYACTPQHHSSPFIACAAHHSDHFRAVPADCGVFLLVPADSARGRVWVQPTGSVLCKLRA